MVEYQQIYWNHLDQGSLWLQYCTCCRRYVFYPRLLCPDCLEPDMEWRQVSGRGRIHSFTIVRVSALEEFKGQVPYVYALVDLAEGVRIPTNIVACPPEQVRVDMPVNLAIIKREGRSLPAFKPI